MEDIEADTGFAGDNRGLRLAAVVGKGAGEDKSLAEGVEGDKHPVGNRGPFPRAAATNKDPAGNT